MKDFKKMMGKDDEKDGMQKEAKLSVLKHLRQMASDMMGDDVKNGMMKKVTVAAPDKAGLKQGLEKAEEMMGEEPEPEAEMEGEDDMENCTPEEIDAKIAELQALKERKMREEA